jgi:molecular chaperone HtpG
MDIKIPGKLAETLSHEQKLHGTVMLSLGEFEPWLRLSGTPFFPEYTDHGPKHLTDTLATCSAIIRDEAWSVISPADMAVLILAVLLHDCAMHLSEDGFISLVKPGNHRAVIDLLGDAPWTTLWVDFLGEASRFDAKKLFALFGDSEPARNPGSDPKAWTLRDRLLIGEFLRRHHARLAHEAAIWGVPGPTDKQLTLKEAPRDVAHIAGLIARSHGQSIRSCLPYLRERYDIREYKGIHSVFLMTIVRIADYLQVHSDRAPSQILSIRQLRSPVSRGEWKAHDSIRDIRNTHEDPEAVFVDAIPSDVKTYLKLKNLLGAIQDELDGSWAALGEVYGRYEKLNPLGLGLRRVRSNLDDDQAFAKTVSYVPRKAAFEAADADLLNLLVEPLYGHRPEIGIRELIQNSVDACRELQDHLAQQANPSVPELTVQDAQVVVTLEESEAKGKGWLEVSDQGIGMTPDVLRNYFLKAGASFRRSDAWRRSHEDKSGKSRVLRSGRFGIGVLASFLLGDEVEVSTRHVNAPADDGIKFTGSIDSSEIELRRFARPVGTTIRIRISREEVWKSLTQPGYVWDQQRKTGLESWDWYCLSDPNVVRRLKKNKVADEQLKQSFSLPVPGSKIPESWHKVSHVDYSEIHWTYEKAPRLTCNGIKVIDSRGPEWGYDFNRNPIQNLWASHRLSLTCPNVSVFDPEGHLPLLLQRTGLATPAYPFHEDLLNDVLKDLFAFILVNAPKGPIVQKAHHEAYSKFYEGFNTGECKWLFLFSLPEGSSIVSDWHLQAEEVHKFGRALLIPAPREMPVPLSSSDYNLPEVILPFKEPSGPQDSRAWFRSVLGSPDIYVFGPAMGLKHKGCRMLLREKTLREHKQPGIIAQYYWMTIQEEFRTNGWVVLRSGECEGKSLDFRKLAESNDAGIDGLAEWYLTTDHLQNLSMSPIEKAWKEIVGTPTIPFDVGERSNKLRRAFEYLKDYLAPYDRVRQKPNKT